MSTKQEQIILKTVALTEKQISTSFGEPSFLTPHHLEFEVNEKKVNIGKRKREGWLIEVFKMARCRMKMIPVMRPGRITVRKEEIELRTISSRSGVSRIPREAMPALLNNVKKLAKKMRMNLMERKPPRGPLSFGRILQTPTLRAFDISRLAMMIEVKRVDTNKAMLR